MIQTCDSGHPLMKFIMNNDYHGFFARDVQSREFRNYPPFANLCLAETKDKDPRKASETLIDLYKEMFNYNKAVSILPPSAALLAKIKNEFRFQMLIKTSRKVDPSASILRDTIAHAYQIFRQKGKHKDVRIIFDMNPYSVV
jgi:primosomal protein N' (replication factor Y)